MRSLAGASAAKAGTSEASRTKRRKAGRNMREFCRSGTCLRQGAIPPNATRPKTSEQGPEAAGPFGLLPTDNALGMASKNEHLGQGWSASDSSSSTTPAAKGRQAIMTPVTSPEAHWLSSASIRGLRSPVLLSRRQAPTLRLTHRCRTRYVSSMTAVEFFTDLSDSAVSTRLPASDGEWQPAAYAQFLRHDPVEGAIYEQLP